jgi:hypothetical protein
VLLDQIDDAVGHAARGGIQQNALLVMKLTDHEQLLPPMGLQDRKPCTRGDQRVDRIKIAPNIVKLAAYCCFDPRPAGPFLLLLRRNLRLWQQSGKQHVPCRDHIVDGACEDLSSVYRDHQ